MQRTGGLHFAWTQHAPTDKYGNPVMLDISSGISSPYDKNFGNSLPSSSRTGTGAVIWSPRAGLVAVTQHLAKGRRLHRADDATSVVYHEALYIYSGYGGWFCDRERQHSRITFGCHVDYDGGNRARNDVWVTYDATNWTRVSRAAPWGARAWAAGTVWSHPLNRSSDISSYARINDLDPKMWISGGICA